MKSTHLLVAVLALFFPAAAAICEERGSNIVYLRFVAASEIYEAVKQQLGTDAVSAITLIDIRGNALGIDSGHLEAPKVGNLIAKLDQRPTTVRVAASVKRIVSATPTSVAREEIIARPTMLGTPNEPMKLTFSDSDGSTVEVEFLVTVHPTTP